MVFTADSFLVKMYVNKVKEGYDVELVPRLFNLYEVVIPLV